MNIKARIYARKILLVYFYEQYFFLLAGKKTSVLDSIDKIRNIVANPGNPEDDLDVNLSEVIDADYYGDFDKEIAYIVQQYFSKVTQENIDYDYIKAVGPHFNTYRDVVEELVNSHAVTFGYADMDLIDRVLFVLGYIEYKELGTPKEVILNELVELAKRYGDESSPKLVNGIGHKMFENKVKSKK